LLRVTAIDESGRKPGRFDLVLDDGTAVIVSVDIIEQLRLRVGVELDGPGTARMLAAAGALRTYDRAVTLLAFRARTGQELRRRLVQNGEPAEFADAAVASLHERGLLDDADYARQFVHSRMVGKGVSRRRVQQELARRGVARDTADEAVDSVLANEEVDEIGVVERAARKKLRSLQSVDLQTRRRRLHAFLARRGYDSDVIRAALTIVLAE